MPFLDLHLIPWHVPAEDIFADGGRMPVMYGSGKRLECVSAHKGLLSSLYFCFKLRFEALLSHRRAWEGHGRDRLFPKPVLQVRRPRLPLHKTPGR